MPVVQSPNPEYDPAVLAQRIVDIANADDKRGFDDVAKGRGLLNTPEARNEYLTAYVRRVMKRLPEIKNVDLYTEANLREIGTIVLDLLGAE